MTGVFLLVESRAAEPIIPLTLFKNRSVSTAMVAVVLTAMGMFGTILFIPLFIQGVIGTSATQSGTVLMPMMLALIVEQHGTGQLIARYGRYRWLAIGGVGLTARACCCCPAWASGPITWSSCAT